ncbi:MAG: PDZ domain-containing protein, partial [Cyanobacteria bacterium SZAS LIN-5]|nr:PDZ domain-containing protein [Cyanobacteria bacterium SZAS LIN-5]
LRGNLGTVCLLILGVILLLMVAFGRHGTSGLVATTGSTTSSLPAVANMTADATADSPDNATADTALFAGCEPANRGSFDGHTLYRCVFNYTRQREYSLIDAAVAKKFAAEFEHKYDQDGMLDSEDGTNKAIAEMLASLNQPHTRFLDVNEFQKLRNRMQGTLSGVGAYVMQKGVESRIKAAGVNPTPGQLLAAQIVTPVSGVYFWPAPLPGGPADRAGVRSGDHILKIGGEPVEGHTFAEVSQLLQGESGSQVQVVVERKSGGNTSQLSLQITRAAVTVPMVQTDDLDNSAPGTIASLTLKAFASKDLHITFAQSIFRLCTGISLPVNAGGGIDFPTDYDPETGCKLKGLVLDFRNDGGGRVDFATIIPQLLIDHGPLVSTLERHGNQMVETKLVLEPNTLVTETFIDGELKSATGADRYMNLLPRNLPIVVLINERSASASEMVAGLLQRHGATIVGTPSYGKEVGQAVIPLAFGTALKTTVLKFKPGDEELGAAIMPDVEVEQSTAYLDDPMTARDAQLTRAVEVLRNRIAQ